MFIGLNVRNVTRHSLVPVFLIGFLGFAGLTGMTGLMETDALAAKKSKKPPHPKDDGAYKQAKSKYEAKTKVMMEAKYEVDKLRAELGRRQAQSRDAYRKSQAGRGMAGMSYQTDEMIKAAAELRERKEALSVLLDQLHELYQHEQGMALRRKIKELEEKLDTEEGEFKPRGALIITMSNQLRELRRELEKMEKTLFQNEEAYSKAVALVQSADNELIQRKKDALRARAQPTEETYPDDSKIALTNQIQEAVAVYSEKARDQHEAKMDMNRKADLATAKYKDWLIKEAKRKQEERNKKFRKGKGKKGKGKGRGHR